jgi:hypothetical protein
MEDFGFELVCANCLATHGLLDSERLPESCSDCGASDPWKGPFALPRFSRDGAEHLAESPFYLGASGASGTE